MSALADSLVPRIREILSTADLSTISAKGVRKQLIAQGYDAARIKEARTEIDAHIAAIFDSLTNNAPPSPSSPTVHSSRPANGASSPSYAPQTSQPVPLLAIKPKSIKADSSRVKDEKPHLHHSTSAYVDGTREETDEEMAARLQAEFNAASTGRASRASAATGAGAKKKKATVKRKSAAVIGSDGEEVEKKKRKGGGGGAFNKEMILSDTLSALVGETRLSRPQTVKRIWDYVKARDMQDPADRRYIRCDEQLRAVFHTDRLHMFTMNKILAEHFMDPAEVVGGEVKPKVQHAAAAAKVEPTIGAVPAGRSAEVVVSDEDEDDDDDDY